MPSCFSCFSTKKESSGPGPEPTSVSQVIAERAKSISQETVRTRDTDDEFQLRLQGFDESDPEFQAAKDEKIKRKSQDMEAKRKAEEDLEEHFQRRLQAV